MAQAPNPEPSDSISFQRFVGIKNIVSEERLTPQEFSSAINVDLDDVGQVRRRRGRKLVASGDWHSLFLTNAGTVLGVRNGALGIVNPNYSFAVVKANIGAHPSKGGQLAYEQVGNFVYFTSPFESGKYDENTQTVSPWGNPQDYWLSPVINPTANLTQIRGKLLGQPPLATCLAYWNGRLYLAQGNVMWATELYLYDYTDKTKNFYQFDSEITMLAAVGDGIYVGTTSGLWFLSGLFSQLKRVPVMDAAVLPGSRVYMPAELANPPQVDLGADTALSLAVLFMTSKGYCAAQNGGQAFNLTETKVAFPHAVRAYPFYRQQDGVHQYVVTLDSGGDPSANSRIGDHVDADLIKAGSWLDLFDGAMFGDSASVSSV